MMRFIVTFILILFSANCFAQTRSVYIGYPNHIDNIYANDKIILDKLPWHPNGFLDKNKDVYFEDMRNFMENHPDFLYNIYLYANMGDSSNSYRLSLFQSKKVQEYLFYSDSLFYKEFISNIIPAGDTHPLFSNNAGFVDISNVDKYFLKESIIIELIRRPDE